VRGRVVDAQTGLPLRHVAVSLRNDREPTGFSTLTEADGGFAFGAVPAGRYRLKAAKPRYVDAALGARRAGGPGRAFDVADGQTIDDLLLRLAVAGVITGRVLDDAGEPVVRASVWATRQRRGERRTQPGQGVFGSTDDTGTFRLFGLPAGQYTLAARADAAGPRDGTLDTSGLALATTYHPGTLLPSEAQPVDVVPGIDTIADVTLIPTRVTTVSGEVVDTGGRPPLGGFVMLIPAARGDATRADGPTASVAKGGQFTLSGVAPGDYTLAVRAFFDESEILKIVGSGSLENTAFTVPLSVSTAPLADLRVVITPTIDLQGRVRVDGAPPPDGSVVVTAAAEGQPEGTMDGPRVTVGADGRFTLRVRPGRWQIAPVSTSKWMPLRMVFRGRSLDPLAPIEVTGDPDERLELHLTSQLTVITGTARTATGAPQRDYHAVLFPAEPAAALPYRNQPRVERADGDGRFRFEGMLPGAYLVAALAEFDAEEPLDDELLDGLRPTATPVRVTHDAIAPLTLNLSPLP
jgi:hypothetical protein